MRIGIDARFFGPQQTGIGRYVERLISHLQRIDHRNDYIVFLRRDGFDAWQPTNPRWRKVLADVHWYTVAEQRQLPGIFSRAKLDILHVPHFNVPVLYRGRFVVTIHDLILDQFPTERASTLEPLIFWAKFSAYKLVVLNAVRRATRVITVSEHSRTELRRRFRLPANRVLVTYESVDPLPAPVDHNVLARRGVRPPYLLYVGNSYPHKNLERLVRAWQRLQARRPGGQLVLAGHRDFFSRRLETMVNTEGIPNVFWYGFASEAELTRLYRSATAYVFPSLSEGFGLPGLEAWEADLPVYAARASCLPEVFGQAASYFDPYDLNDIQASLERAMYDTVEHERLRQAGRDRLKQFSWARMAEETLRVYELSSHGSTPTNP